MANPMKRRLIKVSMALIFGTASVTAQAQLLDSVKSALGGSQHTSNTSGGSLLSGVGLGSGALPSLSSVGTGNITGVIQYCAKNNYLGGDAAGLKDKLLGKLGGQSKAKSDTGYQEGLSGILGGNSNKKVDLTGSGLKQQVTQKVCEQVLSYGKSLL